MTLVLILLQLLLLALIVRVMRRDEVAPELGIALLFYVAVWHCAPVFIALWLWDKIGYRFLVGYDLFVSTAALEALMMLLTVALLLRRKPYFRVITEGAASELNPGPVASLLVVVATLGISLAPVLTSGSLASSTYYEFN